MKRAKKSKDLENWRKDAKIGKSTEKRDESIKKKTKTDINSKKRQKYRKNRQKHKNTKTQQRRKLKCAKNRTECTMCMMSRHTCQADQVLMFDRADKHKIPNATIAFSCFQFEILSLSLSPSHRPLNIIKIVSTAIFTCLQTAIRVIHRYAP